MNPALSAFFAFSSSSAPMPLARMLSSCMPIKLSNRSAETTLGKAEELHHYRTFHNSLDEINTDLDRMLAVTSDDVKRVANTYLAPSNLTLVIVRAGPGGAQ